MQESVQYGYMVHRGPVLPGPQAEFPTPPFWGHKESFQALPQVGPHRIIIQTISKHTTNVVFLLWGSYARKKRKLIDANTHLILESGHPSPLSANRGFWFGNRHFSKANTYLKLNGHQAIVWQIAP